MIKNRVSQVVFQTIYCTLGIVACIASLGVFEQKFNADFYVYYTNLSNYICLGVMLVSLVKTIKKAKTETEGFVDTCPKFKFLCVIMILVTCLVYNLLLANAHSVLDYFTSYTNLTLHLILPIMFVLDWVLFYQHDKLKWYAPLLSTIMPLCYVVFVMIRSCFVAPESEIVRYPYFFLDVDTLGIGGFFGWLCALLLVFVALGYTIYAFDHLKTIKQKHQLKKQRQK